MSESTTSKTTPRFRNSLFEVCKLPIERFKNQTDGRKWKAAASNRKTLAVQLAGYADADGTSIRPSTQTLAEQTGFSRRKVCYLLDDLKELGFIERTGRLGQKGPAIRRLVLPEPTDTSPENPPLRVQDTIPESATLESESAGFVSESARLNPESATAVAHNLPFLPANKPALLPAKQGTVQIADNLRQGMANAFLKARPDEALSLTGFADIETLAARFGNALLLEVWQCWLKSRNTNGMKFHLKMFRKEFDATRHQMQETEQRKSDRAATKKIAAESQANEQKWNAGLNAMAAQFFLDDCTDYADWQARLAEWISSNPPSPVLFEVEGKLVSAANGSERIKSIADLAARHFEFVGAKEQTELARQTGESLF